MLVISTVISVLRVFGANYGPLERVVTKWLIATQADVVTFMLCLEEISTMFRKVHDYMYCYETTAVKGFLYDITWLDGFIEHSINFVSCF